MDEGADLERQSELSQGRRTSRLDGAEASRPINNVALVKVLAPSTLPWGRGGVLAFIFSMFMFLNKRSCVNQTASLLPRPV